MKLLLTNVCLMASFIATPLACAEAPPAPAPASAPAAAPQPQGVLAWTTDYQAGMEQATQAQKPILLYFTGSDWCGWCKKLDQEVLSQPEFARAVGSKFVFIKLDFPMNHDGDAQAQKNAQLKQQYGVTGFPTVVLLDSKGNFIAETGYRAGGAQAYASYLDQLMASPKS